MADTPDIPEQLREAFADSPVIDTTYLLYHAQTTLNTITSMVEAPVPYISDTALENMGDYLHLDINLVMDMLASLVNNVVGKMGISRAGLQEWIDSGEEISDDLMEQHKKALWECAPETTLFSISAQAFFMGALTEALRAERSDARRLEKVEIPEEDAFRLLVASVMEDVMLAMVRMAKEGDANDDAPIPPIGASLNTMKNIHSAFERAEQNMVLGQDKAALFSFMIGIAVGRKLEQA